VSEAVLEPNTHDTGNVGATLTDICTYHLHLLFHFKGFSAWGNEKSMNSLLTQGSLTTVISDLESVSKDHITYVTCPFCENTVAVDTSSPNQTCSCGTLLTLGGGLAPEVERTNCRLCVIMARSRERQSLIGCF